MTAMADRPDIVILITDQHSAHALSCAGNPWLATPAMDALARRGVRFTHAYCGYPLCSPSRASQMTGRYPHQIDCYGNEGKFFWYHDIPRQVLMGWHFAQAGYRCVWAGKDMPPEDGSRDFELLCPWGDAQAAARLAETLAKPGGPPLLAVGNFVNPHNICEYSRGAPLYEGDIGDPPPDRELPLLPANHGVPPDEPYVIRAVQSSEFQAYAARGNTPLEWRRYLWAYYRMIEQVDAHVGRVLAALETGGRNRNALVVVTSDHGDGCAAHAWNQKQTLYEEVVRVPLIMAGPGVRPGSMDGHLVAAGLDLFPTCAEAAGLAVPQEVEGRSLLPLAAGQPVADWRDHVVVETALDYGLAAGARQRIAGRAIIGQRWKYQAWAWGRPREALTDLETDPGEMVNCAMSGRYQRRLEEMRQALHDWTQRTGDRFQAPGHEMLSPAAGWAELAEIRKKKT
jgi:arylsulfatase A-like enzyme